MNDCISAISTAPGTGGVAIIRISGDNSLAIAQKIFFPSGKVKVSDFEPYKMYVGEIRTSEFSDNGMCVYFKAPKSFTGEDVIELHCHGGIAISHGILNEVFACGARPATNGEFTKRAFLNGKLSLSSCEGLIDMINSESLAQIKSGYYLFKEKLKDKIVSVQDMLTDILAQIDANIDYPEEDLIEDDGEIIKRKLQTVLPILQELLNSYNTGKIVNQGVKVALFGETNTGKSSLLNALTGINRAIVTDVAGTTRDVIDANLFYKGIKFTLYDTAGIRETSDKVEQIGIDMSNALIKSADIVLHVIDSTNENTNSIDYSDVLSDKTVITVYNKNDLAVKDISDGKNAISVSCVSGSNLDKLKDMLFELGASNINTDGEYITQERHYYAIKDAVASLENAISQIGIFPIDLVACDIKECWSKLGEITGTTASESIINEIFARFCVGK